MNTAENILPFPSVPDSDNLLDFIDDTPMQQLVLSVPFFKASLPIAPFGINKSYKPVELQNGRAALVHKREAKQFLEDVALILSCQDYGRMLDWDLFHAIGKSNRRVPLYVDMTFFFESHASDVDGPVKIMLDALFSHFKKVAEIKSRQRWNDNRVKRLVLTKEVEVNCPRILIEVRCLISTTPLGRAA